MAVNNIFTNVTSTRNFFQFLQSQLVNKHSRTGQIFEQSRSSEETDRNVYISICFFTAT